MKKYFVMLGLLVTCGVCAVPTLAQNYIGFVDRVDCNRMVGWAADKNRPNVPINVSVYVDGNSSPLMTVLANKQRDPVVGAMVGSGDNSQHGFDFGAPLRDGQPHTFTLKFESSNTLLPPFGPNAANPASITCGAFNAGTASVDVLVVDFKLQNGAPSVRNRLAGLNFSVRESDGVNSHDVTSDVTHFRLLESPNLLNANLSSQPWTPMPAHPLIMELALRNGAGQRYGDRKVMFQVKTATLTSPPVSDTITLEPVLKEYTVSASGSAHPLIQYAASQGFTFPVSFYETCDGSCAGNISYAPNLESGTASFSVQANTSGGSSNRVLVCGLEIGGTIVGGAVAGAIAGGLAGGPPGAVIGASVGAAAGTVIGGLACSANSDTNTSAQGAGTCLTKVDYLLFEVRSPNQFWTIKSVAVPGAFVRFHGANRFLVKFHTDNKEGFCGQKQISIGDVVVEGPADDDFVDPANPWKNAFVRPTIFQIQPGIRRPN